MQTLLPKPLPVAPKFFDATAKKQRKQICNALGHFVDKLQVEGREPSAAETYFFREALDAVEAENFDDAYHAVFDLEQVCLGMKAPSPITAMSRAEMIEAISWRYRKH
jgi:hypothetical protein